MKYAKGTFITVPNKHIIRGLSGNQQALFMWLCSYADEVGVCFPSRSTLAKDIGVTTQTLDKHLKKLCEVGLITKAERFYNSRQSSNEYQIQLKNPHSIHRGKVFNTAGGKKVSNQRGKKVVHRTQSKKELNPKNSITSPSDVATVQVNEVIKSFSAVNPSIEAIISHKAQREATERLIVQYGVEGVLAFIPLIQKANTRKYAPSITTPYELELKLGSLLVWLEKEKNSQYKKKVII